MASLQVPIENCKDINRAEDVPPAAHNAHAPAEAPAVDEGLTGGREGLQELVGDLHMTREEIDEQWAEHMVSTRNSTAGPPTSRPSTTTRSSSSSTTAKAATTPVKKRIEKPRQLQRRHSDGEPMGRRCLT